MEKKISDYLAMIGREGGKIGGQSKSKAKRKASSKNFEKAREARKAQALYPQCEDFHAHTWMKDGRCWGAACRKKYPELRRLSKAEALKARQENKRKWREESR
jgi:hypothetical protein